MIREARCDPVAEETSALAAGTAAEFRGAW
jgi:hypothetical protein